MKSPILLFCASSPGTEGVSSAVFTSLIRVSLSGPSPKIHECCSSFAIVIYLIANGSAHNEVDSLARNKEWSARSLLGKVERRIGNPEPN